MRTREHYFALHLVLACVVSSLSGPLLAQGEELYWLDDYNEVLREAQQTGKPIFLEFRCAP